jgi:hypothetical protein
MPAFQLVASSSVTLREDKSPIILNQSQRYGLVSILCREICLSSNFMHWAVKMRLEFLWSTACLG